MASRAVAVPLHVTFDGRKVDKDEVVAFGGRGRFGEQGDDPLQTQAELPASGVYDGSSISSPLGARASMTAQVISWSRLYRTTRAVLAEREGFEPSMDFRPYTLSRRAPSTARTPLQERSQRKSAANWR